MTSVSLDQVMMYAFIYSYIVAQPLAHNVHAYPLIHDKITIQNKEIQFDKHSEIERDFQWRLERLSYYDDPMDNDIKVISEHALHKSQNDHDISIASLSDTETISPFIEDERERYMKQVEKLSEDIYPGLHSNDVKVVQDILKHFGYYEGEIDGIYGPLTHQALKIAENEYNISLTQDITIESSAKSNEKEPNLQDTENVYISNSVLQTKQVEVEGINDPEIIRMAHSLVGTPYKWGGTSTSGFDCSGFLQYVFQSVDYTIPRTVSDIWNFAKPVQSLSVGDLVFFQTYKPGPSHAGIYIGNGKFIHASESGVEISKMNHSYWESRYLGAKKIPN